MRKNTKTAIAMFGTALIAISAMTGCSSSSATTAETTAAKTTATDLKGSVTMVGSTSMEKFSTALSEIFMEKYPNVTLQAEYTGSGAGVEAVSNGSADMGNSSRNLKEEEKAKGIVENIVAIDGIAVIVDPKNTVANLTRDDLTKIYTGATANWKDLGGADQPIVVIGREAGSGTRGAFEEILKVEDQCQYSNELDSTGAVMAKVASIPGAIGYVSLDVIDNTVKTLALDGTEATAENIQTGSYFLNRPFVMATKGEIDAQNDTIKAVFDFIYSAEGAELVKSVGLIPVE